MSGLIRGTGRQNCAVNNIPFINIYSSRGSSVSDDVVCFMKTEDRFKHIGPIGPVRSVKLCEGDSVGNCGVVCIANPSGRSGASTRSGCRVEVSLCHTESVGSKLSRRGLSTRPPP